MSDEHEENARIANEIVRCYVRAEEARNLASEVGRITEEANRVGASVSFGFNRPGQYGEEVGSWVSIRPSFMSLLVDKLQEQLEAMAKHHEEVAVEMVRQLKERGQ